jgi:hypothetical protein
MVLNAYSNLNIRHSREGGIPTINFDTSPTLDSRLRGNDDVMENRATLVSAQ